MPRDNGLDPGALDRWITGNYGEDQYDNQDPLTDFRCRICKEDLAEYSSTDETGVNVWFTCDNGHTYRAERNRELDSWYPVGEDPPDPEDEEPQDPPPEHEEYIRLTDPEEDIGEYLVQLDPDEAPIPEDDLPWGYLVER